MSEHHSAETARKTLRTLALRGVAPTPENYAQIYQEIEGGPQDPCSEAERALITLIHEIKDVPNLRRYSVPLEEALAAKNWDECRIVLGRMAEHAAQAPAPLNNINNKNMGAIGVNGQSIAVNHGPLNFPPEVLELIAKTLEFTVNQELGYPEAFTREAMTLANLARDVEHGVAFAHFTTQLKQFWFRLETHGGDAIKMHEALMRLLRLLVENTHELLSEDQWLRGQVAVMRNIIDQPLTVESLAEAERSLLEVVFKQGTLRHSLSDAKTAMKQMVSHFIDRVGELSESTGEHHDKLKAHVENIRLAEDVAQLNAVMGKLLEDTRMATNLTARVRDELIESRQRVQDAEAKVKSLEESLTEVSSLVREDPMTRVLNRRGLNDAFEREASRSDRKGRPLCLSILDVDDFKIINDQHGHQAGDSALLHLVDVIKKTMRTSDIISRFGGEEFLILLPETRLDEGVAVMTRLQRTLTKAFFLHNNERLLITFSAGIALRRIGEPRDSVIGRADNALRQAKQAGKNRVWAA